MSKLSPIKILVCEDDPDHRFMILESLEETLQDAEFFEAESGEECRELILSKAPEVLILDYRLGDMDGIELLESIHERLAEIAVLLVTSQGDEKVAVQAMKMGVRDYLVKDTRLVFIDHIPIAVNHALIQIRTEREKARALQELRMSEQLNRMIFDRMAEAVIYADANAQIIHLNDLACRILAMECASAHEVNLRDESIVEKFPLLDRLIGVLEKDDSRAFMEDEWVVDNRILSIRMSPVRTPEGDYRGVIINLADITDRRREEIERLQAIERTVSALAKAVELRDAYTSGHAANVGQIAVMIARRLNWDEHRIIGLKLACELHDIGKIAIPAEILTRPSKLSHLEMDMLREHPQKGYEILKGINFPFPVAEAVYQHHEVLDGSGYPRGLVGDEIIMEARVLVVADVLEAITSFRPYRAGLGISKAIEQIKLGCGNLYDPIVVSAVLGLIDEAGGESFWKDRNSYPNQGELKRLGQNHKNIEQINP
jgi:PAS domain S-box-containing protein